MTLYLLTIATASVPGLLNAYLIAGGREKIKERIDFSFPVQKFLQVRGRHRIEATVMVPMYEGLGTPNSMSVFEVLHHPFS